MQILKEFREFAVRGNAVDLAVGIIIGSAFGALVNSLVNDILMPPVGLLIGNADFRDLFVVLRPGLDQAAQYATLAEAEAAGAVTLNLGLFVNAIISFLIVAAAAFVLVRAINRLQRQSAAEESEPDTRACPYCFRSIPLSATRCPECTSQLPPSGAG